MNISTATALNGTTVQLLSILLFQVRINCRRCFDPRFSSPLNVVVTESCVNKRALVKILALSFRTPRKAIGFLSMLNESLAIINFLCTCGPIGP